MQENILQNIRQLINAARQSVSRHVDSTMTLTYFLVGRYIVEEEQQGEERANYSTETIKFLSEKLTEEYGKGFSSRNLALMKKFYNVYKSLVNVENILQSLFAKSNQITDNKSNKEILQTQFAKSTQSTEFQFNTFAGIEKETIPFILSWAHYIILCRINNNEERKFYEIEAQNNNWTYKELERQYNSSLYERLVLSRNKKKVKELSEIGQVIETPADTIKNPLVLEFLGLKEDSSYSETDLETAIIDKLEHFLLELGKGFLFQGRQVRFTFEEEHFFIDLVFYNRLLRCFVVIDLKIGKLKHQDVGQMQMYVNYYDRFVKTPEENKTIGIIICKDKKDAIVELTLPENNNQIFASQYQLYLPSKEELKRLIVNKI